MQVRKRKLISKFILCSVKIKKKKKKEKGKLIKALKKLLFNPVNQIFPGAQELRVPVVIRGRQISYSNYK